MDIARLGNHATPVGPEIENTAVKPPSPGTPRETSEVATKEHSSAQSPSPATISKPPLDEPTLKTVLSERLTKAWSGPGDEGPEESSSAHLSKGPLDHPALKALVSEKLGGGSGYSGPQIRMDRNDPEPADEGGNGSGPEAPSGDGWGASKSEDPKSLNSNDGNVPKSGEDEDDSSRGVGFGLLGRLGRGGDGRATSGSTPSGSSSSTSGSSSSSGTTGSGSTTTVRPQHK